VFDAARRATPAVAVRMAREQRFQTGTGALTGVLRSSTFHEIAVEVQRLDGSPIVRVYAGPIADSLAISWDGRGSDGHPLLSGRYLLAVSSLDSGRVSRRMVRIPMEVTSTIGDTLPLPPLPEAELLPELKRATGGAEALLGGLVAGTLVAVIPSAAAPDASLAGGRWVVGIALVGAGVAGFLKGQGDRVIAENVAANDSIRAAWREQQAAVTVENARRRDSAGVVVRLGAPQVIEREGS